MCECSVCECSVYECSVYECIVYEYDVCECSVCECSVCECSVYQCSVYECDRSPFTGGGKRTHVTVPEDNLTTEALYNSATEVLIEFDSRRRLKHCDYNVGLIFEYRPGQYYYEPFPRRLRLPIPTLPLENVFIRIRSTHCGGAPESGRPRFGLRT